MTPHQVRILTTAIVVLCSTAVMRIEFIPLALALAPFAHAQAGDSAPLDRVLAFVQPAPAQSAGRPERFGEFLLSTVGPVPLLGEAAGAGIGHWANWPKEWGQGWGAFGKRFGSNLAYNGVRQTITYGGSLLLHEDTRYFGSSQSRFWLRTRHALVSTFTARHANGADSFSFSGTAGVIGAAAISSAWGPSSWKGPANIAENAGISFASTAASNVVREFLPDLLHRPRQ